jgi:hypothetical protein
MQELAELPAETRDIALLRFRLLERHLEQHRSSRQTREFPFGRRTAQLFLAVTPNSEQRFTPNSTLTYRAIVFGLRIWNRRSGLPRCPDALDLVGAAAGQVGGSAAVSPEARSATMLWWAAAVEYPPGVFAGATAWGAASECPLIPLGVNSRQTIDNHRCSATEALEHDFSHQHNKAISRDEPGSRRHGA